MHAILPYPSHDSRYATVEHINQLNQIYKITATITVHTTQLYQYMRNRATRLNIKINHRQNYSGLSDDKNDNT